MINDDPRMWNRMVLGATLGAVSAIIGIFIAPSCFNPDYPTDVQCGPDGFCPSGQRCFDGICLQTGDTCSSGRICPFGWSCAAYQDICIENGCGDGFLDLPADETCDDGNVINGDLCSSVCQLERCGNGEIDSNEQCDDGNTLDGDSCSSICQLENCGDGKVDTTEQCDDGANISGDGCSAICMIEVCGNKIIDFMEACDDGNTEGGDGCSSDCASREVCGNSYLDVNEYCDDGNTNSGDACSFDCQYTKVVDVVAGEKHTCALVDSGAVRCWGYSFFGNLGYGSQEYIGNDEPASAGGNVPIEGNAIAIAAGDHHTCALIDGGAVRCWGRNSSGQLGYGNSRNIGDNEPASAVGDVPLGGSAVALTAGSYFTCALLDTGAVRCWGSGATGQLGHGATNDIGDNELAEAGGDVPIGGIAVAVAAGSHHVCAIVENGTVRCWGRNHAGQLGYGHLLDIGDDEQALAGGDVSLGGTAISIVAGDSHTCALLDTGAVRCWGSGEFGQLGYGNMTHIGDDEAPEVSGDVPLGGIAASVTAGDFHTCALLDNGAVRCWGQNEDGQLGYGHKNNIGDNELADAGGNVSLGGNATAIDAGSQHTCAVLEKGSVVCWGNNNFGQLGYGNTIDVGDNEPPSDAGDVPL